MKNKEEYDFFILKWVEDQFNHIMEKATHFPLNIKRIKFIEHQIIRIEERREKLLNYVERRFKVNSRTLEAMKKVNSIPDDPFLFDRLGILWGKLLEEHSNLTSFLMPKQEKPQGPIFFIENLGGNTEKINDLREFFIKLEKHKLILYLIGVKFYLILALKVKG